MVGSGEDPVRHGMESTVKSVYTTDLPVSAERFLFLDDTHVASRQAVRRNFHQLRRLFHDPLIVPDRPTDQMNVSMAGSVLRDTRDGSFLMWYHSQRFTKQGQMYHICHACSSDGIHWEKPDIGRIEIDGSTSHNVVARSYDIGESPGSNLVLCPDEADDSRRFRRIYQRLNQGTFIAYSPDGINWNESGEFAFHAGDSTTVFYDVAARRFIAIRMESPRIGSFLRRTPAMATSPDFRTWSDFRIIFQCDDLDDAQVVERLEKRRAVLSYAIPEHFHAQVNSMYGFNYAGLIIGIPLMFDCCGYDEWKGTPGGPGSGRDDCVTDIQLAWCGDPDLQDWRRPAARESFLPVSDPPRWDCGFAHVADSPVRVGDELWFYYSGGDRSQQHPMYTLDDGWKFKQGELKSGISIATLRLDGFASLDADRQGGEITTRALPFRGDRIVVNAVSYHGIDVEILDQTGEPIPGYGPDACETLRGDSVRHEVRFRDADIAALAGRTIRVRFHLRGAMLFAFSFETGQSPAASGVRGEAAASRSTVTRAANAD